MFRFILEYDYAFFLLSAYLLFACTIFTNGWTFLVSNNSSIGFQSGCILAAILSALAIIRVFARRVRFSLISRAAIVFFALLLLGFILFWVRVAGGI
jgi:hypothetical protein